MANLLTKEKPISLVDELFKVRMLCFFEDLPQSNRYRQVLMSEAEQNKLMGTLVEIFARRNGGTVGTPGKRTVAIQIGKEFSNELYTLPDLREVQLN